MASHLNATFKAANDENRPVFIAYITVGFPTVEETPDIMLGLQRGGVDVIEMGIPFTDPLADGPTIQEAHIDALKNNVDIDVCFEILKKARSQGLHIPVVFMGYYNPVMQYGEQKFAERSAQAGANGSIIVDLPPEEAVVFCETSEKANLAYIPLITPTTTNRRISHLVSIAKSFIYVVSRLGVTGAQKTISEELPDLIRRIRNHTSLPLAVGFGIGNAEQFREIGALSDGVVIGSKLVSILKDAPKGQRAQAAEDFALEISGRRDGRYIREQPLPVYTTPETLVEYAKEDKSHHWFGEFGGQYVPEALFDCLEELERTYIECKASPEFWDEFKSYYEYIGRPSVLYRADHLTKHCDGATIWLKREDMNHTGAHKINIALGQLLLAKRLGKTRIIAETGAGQHGVATATMCARMGFECIVYMGAEDVRRQALNVFRMRLLGAKVVPVHSGAKTLKDAVNEAIRDWVTNVNTTHYVIGSAIGPHPFPTLVRDFQSIIGRETKEQLLEKAGVLPDAVVACVGGGSNAIGIFYPFIGDKSVRLVGAEAAGYGIDTGHHSATLGIGTVGVFHGAKMLLLQNEKGQIMEPHSVSAGLDYPGVGPEHCWLKATGRGEYSAVSDKEALIGFRTLCETEGIIPALESSHAIYRGIQLAKELGPSKNIVICLSGRGDKDVNTVAEVLPEIGPQIGWDLRFEADPSTKQSTEGSQ
ncbi:hypothetical protein EV182_001353 [Spiromyces aspiralis]|uniref:Uncharacterized protein n=1 Tax=Spiromyces aspiralis TaxID=68401 RepID=A0ACC1HZB5_9FUNG|nr:hypothetical protein EV182_001353 [Spiromyces aspiralis]